MTYQRPPAPPIPAEIKEANRRRARELAERNADVPLSAEAQRFLNEVWWPHVRRFVAEQQAQRDAEQACDD